MALSFVAQSARGTGQPPVPQAEIDKGDVDPRALPDPLARRGRPGPRQGDRRLLDLGRRARHERLDLHRARRSPRPAPTSPPRCPAAVGALSGPLHGGAPSRVLQMLDEVERDRRRRGLGQGRARPRRAADGLRPPRLPRRGPARPRAAPHRRARSARRASRSAEALEQAALAELHARKPDRVLATNVEFWSAVVLDFADVPPELFTPMFTCARVAGWSAHILEQKREGRLIRPDREVRRSRAAPGLGGAAARGRAGLPGMFQHISARRSTHRARIAGPRDCRCGRTSPTIPRSHQAIPPAHRARQHMGFRGSRRRETGATRCRRA